MMDPGFNRYTAETMLPLLRQLQQELSGVKSSEDIEYVHRARVATRRLRACFTIFSPSLPTRSAKSWKNEIRGITKALGEARDLDVQMAFVREYISETVFDSCTGEVLFYPENILSGAHAHLDTHKDSLFRLLISDATPAEEFETSGEEKGAVFSGPIDPERPGLECLLNRIYQRRRIIQPEVIQAVDRIEEAEVIESIATCLHEQKIRAELEDTGSGSLVAYEQAFLHIMTAISDLFWFEPWLLEPKMIHRHHEMRIAAKRLRYTLESFADLFECGLKSEIKTFKSLQDILGDMHDCDIWIEKIPLILADEEKRSIRYFGNSAFFSLVKPGLCNLFENRQKIRNELFKKLHILWDSLKEDKFWTMLEEKIAIPIHHSFQANDGSCHEGQIKIAFISDVHANLPALEAVLADAGERGATAVLNAGDSIGYGAFPDEVVSLLRTSHVLSVIGNYDNSVLTKKWKTKRPRSRDKQIAMRYAYHHLSKENRAYLRGLPREQRLRVKGKSILVTHGSPGSLTEYLVEETPDSRYAEIVQKTKADIIVTGHAHLPSIREVDGVLFVNCGSVGRTEDGDPRACYALLTFEPFSVVHIRVPYDITKAIEAIRKRHLPDSFTRIISEGKPLDVVSKPEDNA